MSIRFKTQLRGMELEVEMELLYGPEPAFKLIFHGQFAEAKRPIRPTREELAFLCREAAKHSRKRELQ